MSNHPLFDQVVKDEIGEITKDIQHFQFIRSETVESYRASVHHTYGQFLRNHYRLWVETTPLRKELQAVGLTHPDDMSSCILNALHGHFNNQKYDIQPDVAKYAQYWANLATYGNQP